MAAHITQRCSSRLTFPGEMTVQLALRTGVYDAQGLRDSMEDACTIDHNLQLPSVLGEERSVFLGVYDGHGGRRAADFAAFNLPPKWAEHRANHESRTALRNGTPCALSPNRSPAMYTNFKWKQYSRSKTSSWTLPSVTIGRTERHSLSRLSKETSCSWPMWGTLSVSSVQEDRHLLYLRFTTPARTLTR